MYFTDYIITESSGNSLDPLGFLRPSSEITDSIFKQFTVLSNHPSYHGFLCAVFLYLEGKGLKPGEPGFSRRFREIEILWGILNTQHGDSILNVTKYSLFVENGVEKLPDVNRNSSIYARLNYGALGHYSSPSIYWRILDSKGIYLTDLGRSLGISWKLRSGVDFSDLITRWLDGKSVLSTELFESAKKHFVLSALPSRDEQQVWKNIIKRSCSSNLVIAPLWEHPVPEKVLQLGAMEDSYIHYFPSILAHFSIYQDISRRIDLCSRFELLAGLIQLVFEWEYVRRLEEVKVVGIDDIQLEQVISKEIESQASELLLIYGQINSWKLLTGLSGLKTYQDQSKAILDHHTFHQKAKGTSPFIVGDNIAVRDRVDYRKTSRILEKIKENPSKLAPVVQYQYRRDWHFNRASRWLKYAGGLA